MGKATTRLKVISGLALLSLAAACSNGSSDGGVVTPVPTPTPTPTPTPPVSAAPVITTPAAVAAPENAGVAYLVLQVAATDPENDPITFSLSGPDAAVLDLTGDKIAFNRAPDFEAPGDADRDNVYRVQLRATDSHGVSSTQDIAITIHNLIESGVTARALGTYSNPVFVTQVPGSTTDVFVALSDGTIYRRNADNAGLGTLYLSSAAVADPGTVLSIAPAPDFSASGLLYVAMVASQGFEIRRFRQLVSGLADPASNELIFRLPEIKSATGRVGGWIGFGPDANLYVGIGAPYGQATSPYFGTILRLDVSRDGFPADAVRNYAVPAGNPNLGPDTPPEVVALGLTNPASASFEGTSLLIANTEPFQPGVQAAHQVYELRPADFGVTFGLVGTQTRPVILTGARRLGGPAIVGGFVYRGPITALNGHYVFLEGDTIQSLERSLFAPGTSFNITQGLSGRSWLSVLGQGQVNSFGQDGRNNLYYVVKGSTAPNLFRFEAQ